MIKHHGFIIVILNNFFADLRIENTIILYPLQEIQSSFQSEYNYLYMNYFGILLKYKNSAAVHLLYMNAPVLIN